MAVFSTNQNRQLYVVKSVIEALNGSFAKTATAGAITVCNNDGKLYFKYLNANGKAVRSDLIDVKSITYLKHSEGANMKLNQVTLTFDANVNGGKLIAGEDYILRINFHQACSMSDEDIFQKYGAVHVTSAMVTTPALFYKMMAASLVKNFKRLYSPLVSIALATAVDSTTFAATATTAEIVSAKVKNGVATLYDEEGAEIAPDDVAGIVITQKCDTDDYMLGVNHLDTVPFDVIPTTVFDDGDEVTWGVVSDITTVDGPANGYKMADLEWFCAGEKGDQYRNANWPDVIPTKYMITDYDKNYDTVEIHYAYQGSCEDIQKSEKDITLVFDASLDVSKLFANINSATGVAATDDKYLTVSAGE